MRIIAVGTLRDFWRRPGRSDAEQPLRTWVHVVKGARWARPTDVKLVFRSADILTNDRVVFNIGGNKYRLIARIHYHPQLVLVQHVLTHAEYDRGDWKQ